MVGTQAGHQLLYSWALLMRTLAMSNYKFMRSVIVFFSHSCNLFTQLPSAVKFQISDFPITYCSTSLYCAANLKE